MTGFTPFELFLAIFLLFAIWALVEVISAHTARYSDRWFCTITCTLVIACSFATMTTFKAHWEYYEVKWGVRDIQETTFIRYDFPESAFTVKSKHRARPGACSGNL